jgi:hypothetical protein
VVSVAKSPGAEPVRHLGFDDPRDAEVVIDGADPARDRRRVQVDEARPKFASWKVFPDVPPPPTFVIPRAMIPDLTDQRSLFLRPCSYFWLRLQLKPLAR